MDMKAMRAEVMKALLDRPGIIGHAPGHILSVFDRVLKEWTYWEAEYPALAYEWLYLLFGKLWRCTDIMPSNHRDALVRITGHDHIPLSCTYARAARLARAILRERAEQASAKAMPGWLAAMDATFSGKDPWDKES